MICEAQCKLEESLLDRGVGVLAHAVVHHRVRRLQPLLPPPLLPLQLLLHVPQTPQQRQDLSVLLLDLGLENEEGGLLDAGATGDGGEAILGDGQAQEVVELLLTLAASLPALPALPALPLLPRPALPLLQDAQLLLEVPYAPVLLDLLLQQFVNPLGVLVDGLLERLHLLAAHRLRQLFLRGLQPLPEMQVLILEGVVLLLVGSDEVLCGLEGGVADGALALEVRHVLGIHRGRGRLVDLRVVQDESAGLQEWVHNYIRRGFQLDYHHDRTDTTDPSHIRPPCRSIQVGLYSLIKRFMLSGESGAYQKSGSLSLKSSC